MPHGTVDWAALAQQWIQTKDVPEQPMVSQQSNNMKPPGDESGGGEASMELCEPGGEENGTGWEGATWNQNWQGGNNWQGGVDAGWNGMGWEGNGTGPGWQGGGGGGYQQFNQNQFEPVEPEARIPHGNGFGNSHMADYNSGNHRQTFPRSNRREIPSLMDVQTTPGGFESLNEDQKKKLPSWIRDGLEKMEKDKRKKEEEDYRKQRTEEKKRKRREEQEALVAKDPTRSRFDNASDGSGDEDPPEKIAEERKPRKSRFEAAEIPVLKISAEEPKKSKEDLLQEMSLNLRKILTTILLEVTSEEMTEMCEDVLRKETGRTNKPKLKSMLSGYGSNSDSENEDEEENDVESDEETQKTLKKKQKKFDRMEDEIKKNCLREEARYKQREKRWLAGDRAGTRRDDPDSSPEPPHRSRSESKEPPPRQSHKSRSPSVDSMKRRDKSDTPEKPKKESKREKERKRSRSKNRGKETVDVKPKKKSSRSPESKRRRSRSSESHRSKRRSRSRDRRSRSNDRRSRSRDRRSRSRQKRSVTRERRSKSRSRQRKERTREKSPSRKRTPEKSRRSRSREPKKSKKSKKSRKRSDSGD